MNVALNLTGRLAILLFYITSNSCTKKKCGHVVLSILILKALGRSIAQNLQKETRLNSVSKEEAFLVHLNETAKCELGINL